MNYKYNERKQCWLTWPKVILLGILMGLIGTILVVVYLSSVAADLEKEQRVPTNAEKMSWAGLNKPVTITHCMEGLEFDYPCPTKLKIADSGSQPLDLQPSVSHWALFRTYNVQDNR